MVNQYAWRIAHLYHFAQFVDALERVEVEAEYEIGIANQKAASQLSHGIDHHITNGRDKLQCARHLVGHNHISIFAHIAEHSAQSQSAAKGIAVGRKMAGDNNMTRRFEQLAQLLYHSAIYNRLNHQG